jgi:hypothetical protein
MMNWDCLSSSRLRNLPNMEQKCYYIFSLQRTEATFLFYSEHCLPQLHSTPFLNHATRSSGSYTTGPRYLDFPPSSFPHLCHKNSKHESARDISSSHSWQRVKHSEERYYRTPLQQYSKTVLDCCFITSSNTPSFALETLEVDSHSKKPQLSSRSR